MGNLRDHGSISATHLMTEKRREGVIQGSVSLCRILAKLWEERRLIANSNFNFYGNIEDYLHF